jgi:hypothetical protein
MASKAKLPNRLHHNAYVSRDLEATRRFYEDVIGLPLLATWCEKTCCSGPSARTATASSASATAERWRSSSSPTRRTQSSSARRCRFPVPPHCPARGQGDAGGHRKRLKDAGYQEPQSFVLEHGYCRSVYATDP